MKPQIKYIKVDYDYQLYEDYFIKIKIYPEKDIVHPLFNLQTSGMLMVYEGYYWDGPSGPTWDDDSNMRGSLVHDVLYQMMREGLLPRSRKNRAYADKLFYKMLRQDGMSWFRARYYLKGVRKFGKKHTQYKKNKVYKAPEKVK
jgi:hypothetical protein